MRHHPEPPPLEALLERHSRWLRALARSLVSDAAAADDVAQSTLLAAIESPPRSPGAIRSFLATVARRFASDERRAGERRRRRERGAARPERIPSTEEIVREESARRLVVDAVLALREPYRSAVVLRYFEDLPPRRIARLLGVEVETVRTRLKRALAELREKLDGRVDGGRGAWCALLVPLARRAGGFGAVATAGGILVSAKKSAVAAAAAVVILGAATVTWVSTRPAPHSEEAGGEAPEAIASAPPTSLPASESPSTPAAAPPAPVSSEGRVTGRVLDADGRPIAGARVLSFPEGRPSPVLAFSAEDRSDRVRTAAADDAGFFALALREGDATFTVIAQSPGFAPASATPVRAGDDLVLTLASGGAIRGTVVDVEGKPVAGARVRWSGKVAGTIVACEGESASDGKFRIEGLPARWNDEVFSSLHAAAAGFAPVTVRFGGNEVRFDGSEVVERDVVLGRGARVDGRVVDADSGDPIPGVPVSFRSLDESRADFRADPATSAADGTFAFPHLPANGFHTVQESAGSSFGKIIGYCDAAPPGYAPAAAEVPLRSDGESWNVLVRCWPQGTVEGRVVDGAGAPIAGARVYAIATDDAQNGFRSTATTDTAGRYSIPNACASRSRAVPTTVFAQTRGEESRQARVEVGVVAGTPVTAPDIVFATWPSAEIVVTDRTGVPVAGALAGRHYGSPLGSRSDATGRIRVEMERAPSAPLAVVVMASGFARTATPDLALSVETPPTVRVSLEPAHGVAGRVVRADGSPAPGVQVLVASVETPIEDAFPPPMSVPPASPVFRWAGVYDAATTGHDGRFEFRDLPAGPYHLAASARSNRTSRSLEAPMTRIEFVPADATEVEIRLPESVEPDTGPAVVVRGTVHDGASGLPVAVFDCALARGETRLRARRERPGRFAIDAVPPGDYLLEVSADGFVPIDPLPVEIGPSGPLRPIEIALDRGATVRGTLRPDAGVDMAERDYSLHFIQPGVFGRMTASLAPDGTYVATGFRPGRYRPYLGCYSDYIRAAAGPAIGEELVVPAGATEVVFDCRLVRTGAVNFAFSNGERLAASHAPRFLVRDSNGRIAWEERGVLSQFAIQLPVGAYTVHVLDGETEIARAEFVSSAEEVRTMVRVEVP